MASPLAPRQVPLTRWPRRSRRAASAAVALRFVVSYERRR
jgi:hypothetical protein